MSGRPRARGPYEPGARPIGRSPADRVREGPGSAPRDDGAGGRAGGARRPASAGRWDASPLGSDPRHKSPPRSGLHSLRMTAYSRGMSTTGTRRPSDDCPGAPGAVIPTVPTVPTVPVRRSIPHPTRPTSQDDGAPLADWRGQAVTEGLPAVPSPCRPRAAAIAVPDEPPSPRDRSPPPPTSRTDRHTASSRCSHRPFLLRRSRRRRRPSVRALPGPHPQQVVPIHLRPPATAPRPSGQCP